MQPEVEEITVEPPRGWLKLRLREVWSFRELLFFLVWRDLSVRYKQTVFGASWAIIQPVLTMIVFSVIFGKLAKLPSNGIPYPIFSYTALLPWQLFSARHKRCGLQPREQSKHDFEDLLPPVGPTGFGRTGRARGFRDLFPRAAGNDGLL